MPRLRALLAILLAVTWCSAAWHVDLEAVGLLLEHKHHADHDHDAGHDPDHSPVGAHDEHEKVFARDVAKEQIRVTASTGLWLAVIGCVVWLVAALPPALAALIAQRRRQETDPPFRHVWQFIWRCAPLSAAPPRIVLS